MIVTVDCDYLGPGIAAAYVRLSDAPGDRDVAIIETNTALAVPKILAALRAHGRSPDDVRYVIVTHVHLDHAGGASALVAACPRAVLLAHPRAARHLIDPSKLVASATTVYGADRFGQLYGTIAPAPADRVRALDDGAEVPFAGDVLRFLHTRGHANHHFVVHDLGARAAFTGDAFGLVYPQLQRAGTFALPSTSPTDFDAAAAHAAIDRILALAPERAYLTHFGAVTALAEVAAQLHGWLDLSARLVADQLDEPTMRRILADELEQRAAAVGLALTDADRALLALDLDLNAQGLAYVARRAG